MKERLEKSENYRIKRRLAIGGMGEIYLVETQNHNKFTDGLVVAKGPPDEIIHNKNKIDMLNEEGRLALRLRHQNIVNTYVIENDREDLPLLLMEYLSGPSLSEILGRAKLKDIKIPIHFILQVIKEISCGLHFAHTLKNQFGNSIGIVHRDISPANILVTANGEIKIIDFGIAKSADSEVKTKTGTIKGKLSYMAPEHITGKRPDVQADIWALGVVLWESLAVDRLFSGNTFQAVIQQVLHFPIVPPSTVNKKIPQNIDAICMKLLKREKEDRYKSCEEVYQDLDKLKINWSPEKSADLIKNIFPRKTERWLHEAGKIAKLRVPIDLPKGLIDGGIIETETLEFGENEKTSTTKKIITTPFDWSEFSESTSTSTFTGSNSGFQNLSKTMENDPINLSLPNVVQKAVKENISYQHGFDEDPWSELTSTREIPSIKKDHKIESDISNLLDLNENPTQTQSFAFDKFQSEEAIALDTNEVDIKTLDSMESYESKSVAQKEILKSIKVNRWKNPIIIFSFCIIIGIIAYYLIS